jgi:sulfur transfer protein SufE
MAFAVETDSDQWTLRVRDVVGSETLYTAHRSGARAAQIAAAEFAIFRELGLDSRVTPDRLAGELKWQEYW